MFFAAILALFLTKQAFHILLQIGAGIGLLFILRWFWYRINAWSEITAMVVSFIVALYFQLIHAKIGLPEISPSLQFVLGILVTSIAWVSVTLMTKPSKEETLKSFYRLIRPGGPGWKKIKRIVNGEQNTNFSHSEELDVPVALLCMVLGSFMIYAILFTIGYFIYGNLNMGFLMSCLSVLSGWGLLVLWKKLRMN